MNRLAPVVSSQRLARGCAERDLAFLSSLAHDPDHAFLQVDILRVNPN